VTDALKERVGQQNFDIWIKPFTLFPEKGEKVELEVPNRFFKEWINEHYSVHIKEAISLLTRVPLSAPIPNQKRKDERKGPGFPTLPS